MLSEYPSQKAEFTAVLQKFGVRSSGANLKRDYKTTLTVFIPKNSFTDDTASLVEDSVVEFFKCEVDKSRTVVRDESIAVQMLLAL